MRRKTALSLMCCALSACVCKEPPARVQPAIALDTDEQKTLYALGVLQARNLEAAKLTPAELSEVQAGLSDGVTGATLRVDMGTYGPKAQNIVMARRSADRLAAAAAQRTKDAPFLAQKEKEAGVEKRPSGLLFKVVKAGGGPSPGVNDRARVRYDGHLTDGTPFEGSAQHADSETIAMTAMIPCWNEALRGMKTGEAAELVCPPELAFGDKGREPQVPPGAALVFNVELLEVLPPAPPRPRRHGAKAGSD